MPSRALAAETLKLERTLSDLVNQAYGLTRLGGFEGVLVRKSLIINAIVFKVFTTEPVRLKVLET